MSSNDNARWWLHRDGQTQGPYACSEIQELYRSRQIAEHVLCCALGEHTWETLAEVAEFKPLFLTQNESDTTFEPAKPNPYKPSQVRVTQCSKWSHPRLASWVARYLLIVFPLILGLHIVLSVIEATDYDKTIPVHRLWIGLAVTNVLLSLAMLVMSVIAGVGWREQRPSALICAIICLVLSTAWDCCLFFIELFTTTLMLALVEDKQEYLQQASLMSNWDLALLIGCLATLIINVVILLGLIWNKSRAWLQGIRHCDTTFSRESFS